jgi:hypothetical protein
MDTFYEIDLIAVIPILIIVAAIAAFGAYRLRHTRFAMALVVVAAAGVAYAVIWTFTPP